MAGRVPRLTLLLATDLLLNDKQVRPEHVLCLVVGYVMNLYTV